MTPMPPNRAKEYRRHVHAVEEWALGTDASSEVDKLEHGAHTIRLPGHLLVSTLGLAPGLHIGRGGSPLSKEREGSM